MALRPANPGPLWSNPWVGWARPFYHCPASPLADQAPKQRLSTTWQSWATGWCCCSTSPGAPASGPAPALWPRPLAGSAAPLAVRDPRRPASCASADLRETAKRPTRLAGTASVAHTSRAVWSGAAGHGCCLRQRAPDSPRTGQTQPCKPRATPMASPPSPAPSAPNPAGPWGPVSREPRVEGVTSRENCFCQAPNRAPLAAVSGRPDTASVGPNVPKN